MINFQDFSFDDTKRYLSYLTRCIQLPSMASPFLMLAYKDIHQIRRGYAADLCWHTETAYGSEHWTTPLGDWDEVNWQEVFKKHVPAGTLFTDVPEYLVNIWRRELGEYITVEEDRNDWDYILYLDRMEKLEGKKLKSFRMARNAFEKNYNYTIEDFAPEAFDELRAFQVEAERDLTDRAQNLENVAEDNADFLFTLEHWDELENLFGFIVRVDGKIVAYCLDEQIDETHSIGISAKANYDYKGINQFAYWQDAKMNLDRGILTQNIMDDGGEKNLRFFKEHLAPLVMMKKFNVTYDPATEELASAYGLNISFNRAGKDLTLSLSGKFNTNAADAMKNGILSSLNGVQNLVVDLNGLEYISSSGLRILIAAMKQIRAQKGEMTVKNVAAQVREVFDMTGFTQIFNLED